MMRCTSYGLDLAKENTFFEMLSLHEYLELGVPPFGKSVCVLPVCFSDNKAARGVVKKVCVLELFTSTLVFMLSSITAQNLPSM